MTHLSSTVLRQLIAIVLMAVLTLGVGGRGLAASSDMHALTAGDIPICSTVGDASGGQPGHPASHDCCDQCTLCGPALTPDHHVLADPVSIEYVAGHAQGLEWTPVIARVPTPRLSQGPPAA